MSHSELIKEMCAPEPLSYIRRHKIMIRNLDGRTYYQDWWYPMPRTNDHTYDQFTLWVRSDHMRFYRRAIGRFTVKHLKQ